MKKKDLKYPETNETKEVFCPRRNLKNKRNEMSLMFISPGMFSKYKCKWDIFLILLKNIRPYRSIHYAGLVIGGVFISCWLTGIQLNIWSALSLILAVILSFQAACVMNDFVDQESDKISNPERPLVANKIPPEIYRKWGLICLFTSLILSISVGWMPFVFICLFQILYTIYSVPPFRLKRYFPINTAIIATNGLIAMMAGFSIVVGEKVLFLFPLRIALMLMVAFLTAGNIIHIKDREGDLVEGIWTIPTMMSERRARIVIALLTIIAYFSVPLILKLKNLLYPSILGGGVGSLLVLRKNWREGPYFLTYFVYYLIMLYFLRADMMKGEIG